MTDFSPSITIEQALDAMKVFLAPICGIAEIVRAQVNRVAMPPSPCVVMTEVLQIDLGTPAENQTEDSTATISGPKRADIQLDFYGDNAGEMCSVTKSALRTDWGYNQFPANIKPLWSDDGRQNFLTTGEQQYETRWILTVALQVNSAFTVPQQSANVLAVAETINVNLEYPL